MTRSELVAWVDDKSKSCSAVDLSMFLSIRAALVERDELKARMEEMVTIIDQQRGHLERLNARLAEYVRRARRIL